MNQFLKISIYIFLYILLLILHIKLIKYIYNNNNEIIIDTTNSNILKIPKIIWTYWDNSNIPKLISFCIDSWKKYNPDYTINVLSSDNLHLYTDINIKNIKWNDSSARQSDIIRLIILEKYGGIWIDASTILTKPLNINDNFEFIGYYLEGFTTNPKYPVIESWFFATIPHGNFISKWKNAFFKLNDFNEFTVFKALDYYKNLGVDFQKISSPSYLFIHVAAQYVLQKELSSDEIKNTMLLLKAEEGPFKYLHNNNWNSQEAINDLCNGNNTTDVIKLRRTEREIFDLFPDLYNCEIFKMI